MDQVKRSAGIMLVKKITLPLVISGALAFVYIALVLLKPGLLFDQAGDETALGKYMLAALLLGVSVIIVRAVSYTLFDIIFFKRKRREAPALLRGLLSVVLYSIFLVLIFRWMLPGNIGFEVLATSTIVAAVIGLALQDTFGNFFAGLSINVEQPFQILDAIQVGEHIGRVEAITWRATTIRTNNNTIIVFPNSRIAREPIEVFRYNNLNRRVMRFPGPYSTPPETVINLMKQATVTIPNVAPEKTPIVRIAEFADSSITYEVLYWVKDYMWVQEIDAKIRENIWYVYGRNQMSIPFPVRHVFMEQSGAVAPEQSDYEGVLDQVDLFEPLNAHEREAVANGSVKYVYAPGELILRRGDPGDSMFIVCKGKVEVRLPASNGGAQQVAVLEKGSFFGEMALLTGEARTADVYALDEVEVLEIRKQCIQQLLIENETLAESLSSKIAERNAEIAEYARSMQDDEKRRRTETILLKVRRFFGLRG
jgi:small-conductance mechanosensitive channel/CRP-like cAMP-binding protein